MSWFLINKDTFIFTNSELKFTFCAFIFDQSNNFLRGGELSILSFWITCNPYHSLLSLSDISKMYCTLPLFSVFSRCCHPIVMQYSVSPMCIIFKVMLIYEYFQVVGNTSSFVSSLRCPEVYSSFNRCSLTI